MIILNVMYRVAIIVLHFKNKEDTVECLYSLKDINTREKITVFVVDNGTNTFTKKTLKSILPNSVLIKSSHNLGVAGGNNLAIEKALKNNNDFILLLDNDTVASPSIIDDLIKPFHSPKVGITGGIITYYYNPKKIWFAGGTINKKFCFTRHINMNKTLNRNLNKKRNRVDYITGACMMVRSDLFKKIGFLDEDYFWYWEDVDLCLRAQEIGYTCYFVNKPLIKHKVSSSGGIKGTNKLTPVRAYFFARNAFFLIKKNNLPSKTGIIGQLFIRLPSNMFLLENFAALRAYIKGFIDGMLFRH